MKNKNAIIAVFAALVLALVVWMVMQKAVDVNEPIQSGEEAVATTTSQGETTTGGTKPPSGGTPAPSSGLLEAYGNATYNFKISYPRELSAGPFSVFHRLNNNDWRVNATSQKRGTPVIEIPVVQIDTSTAVKRSYPLFYTAAVRVGISPDTAQCYATDDGYSNQTVTDVTINGVKWKKFVFGDAAMQQYVNGASYRTIRNNTCYVVEQIRHGSSYKDSTLATGYTDAQLDAFYAKTTPIVMSFTFTK